MIDQENIHNQEIIDSQEGAELDNPSQLATDGTNIIENAKEFEKEVSTIYETVKYLSEHWTGESSKRFEENMEKFREEFESFGPVCEAFGSTIKEVGEDYVKLEEIM